MQITKQYDTDLVERAQLNIFCQDIILSMWVGHKSTFSQFLRPQIFLLQLWKIPFLLWISCQHVRHSPGPGLRALALSLGAWDRSQRNPYSGPGLRVFYIASFLVTVGLPIIICATSHLIRHLWTYIAVWFLWGRSWEKWMLTWNVIFAVFQTTLKNTFRSM